MKNLRCLIAVAAFAAGLVVARPCVYAQPRLLRPTNEVASQNIEDFQVTLTTEKRTYSAGDPVRVDVVVKNLADQTRQFPYPNQSETYLNIIVQGKHGELVPVTAYGAQGYIPPDFTKQFHPYSGPIRLDLTPAPVLGHQKVKYRILISRLYDMTQEGVYLISVKQWVPRLAGKDIAVLASPSLQVLVGPEIDTISPSQTNPHIEGKTGNGLTQFSIGQKF